MGGWLGGCVVSCFSCLLWLVSLFVDWLVTCLLDCLLLASLLASFFGLLCLLLLMYFPWLTCEARAIENQA